jgi:anti-sigma regulatory factor (Ser/Thr protein kinase)/ActR/RegA family two-component response regulator
MRYHASVFQPHFRPGLEVGGPSFRTAIIIDADSLVESALARSLNPDSWSIRHVCNNSTALALAEVIPCDLILTSEKTSGREDLELLRRLRRVRPHIRLIILTDEATPSDTIASLREHAFSYFSRPFSSESLARMIRSAADGPCWDEGIEVLSATPVWMRLAVSCDLKTAQRLVQFINEFVDIPDSEREDVATAFREILWNALEHGAQFNPNEFVEISYVRARHMIICRVKDPGEGFSMDQLRHTALAIPFEDPVRHSAFYEAQGLRPGGYGLLLARELVDELIYDEKGNDVLLIKYLDSSRSSKLAKGKALGA